MPTENSVWSPKPFVTMLHALPSYAPHRRTSIWMLLILRLFACDAIFANHSPYNRPILQRRNRGVCAFQYDLISGFYSELMMFYFFFSAAVLTAGSAGLSAGKFALR